MFLFTYIFLKEKYFKKHFVLGIKEKRIYYKYLPNQLNLYNIQNKIQRFLAWMQNFKFIRQLK